MPRDMEFFVAVGGLHAPSTEALSRRVTAAARADGGQAVSTPVPAPGTRVFGFADAAAALRLAQAAFAQKNPADVPASGAGLATRGSQGGRASSAANGAALAASLAERAHPGCMVVTGDVRAHLCDALAAAACELGPITLEGGDPVRIYQLDLRAAGDPGTTISLGAFELDTARFELRHRGGRVPVEPRTFDLLALLARNIDRTMTKQEIFRAIWGGRIVSDAALSSQIKAARQALGDDGRKQQMIATVHGRGFRMRTVEAAPLAAGVGHTMVPNSPPSRRPTLVALPFSNLDEDGRGAVIASGLTEDLINALTKTRWLRVTTRNPAFPLNHAVAEPGRIAQALGADYLLTGSLRHAGNRVRITVQATDVGSMRCLWSESFDREMRDIFDLQDEIATLVAARLANELGISERRKAARAPRTNLGAWELYQLGSAEFYRFTPESNRRCRKLMRQAIRLDPGFGEPYARLAYAIILEIVYFEGALVPGRLDEALALAEAGVARDDQDANALFALGRVRLARQEYDLAIDALEHAVQLNPCHALSWCGLGDSLAYEGRIDEALKSFDRAIELGPHDPFRWAFMSYRALAHLFAAQFELAASWARHAAHVPNAHYWARVNLLSALGHLGDRQQATTTAAQLMAERPEFTCSFARERMFFVKKPDQMNLFLEGLRKAGIPS